MNKNGECLTILALCIILILTSGCMTRKADLTIVSTRNVSLDKVDLDSLPQNKGIMGEDSKWIFFVIPAGRPHLEDAIDDALNKGNGDVMVDVAVYRGGWWFLIGRESIKVKGNVLKTRGL